MHGGGYRERGRGGGEYFVGHCPAENILLDTILQRIFCRILSSTEYFVGHYPAENILSDTVLYTENILSDTVLQRIFYWILSYREYLSDTVLQSICWTLRERERERGREETHLRSITGDKFVEVEGDNLTNVALCTLDHFGSSSLEQ